MVLVPHSHVLHFAGQSGLIMKPPMLPILRAFVLRLVHYVLSVALYQATCHVVDRLQPLSSSPSGYFSSSSPHSPWDLSLAFGIGLLFTLIMTGLFHLVAYRFASGKSPGCQSCPSSCRIRGRSKSSSPTRGGGRYLAKLVRSGSTRGPLTCPRCRSSTADPASASPLNDITRAGPSTFMPTVSIYI